MLVNYLLQGVLTKVQNDIVTIGDFNAEVGSNDDGLDKDMGKCGRGLDVNQNRQQLVEIGCVYNLVIVEQYFL